MKHQPRHHPPTACARVPRGVGGRRRHGGFTLIVSLILLVVITLVATASMRSVALQSRMSAASFDRSLVYQSAESGLREAEGRALTSTPANFPAAGCQGGYCVAPAAGDTARWADPDDTGWLDAVVTVSTNAPAAQTLVESNGVGQNYVGCAQAIPPMANCLTPRFRVTSRINAAGRASVILQSDVASP